MVCDLPMPHAAKARTRTADALDLTAEATDWIGWMTFSAVNILTASDALLHGTGVTLDDVMPGLAAYGAARIAVFFLETAAEQTRPDWTVTRTPGGDYR